jgi:hypothetical protein
LTPFPATPLYTRLEKEGRLTRPKHWLDFAPFVMAHTPSKMTISDAKAEVEYAWSRSYSPERNGEVLEAIKDAPLEFRISHFVSRIFFRGIYFPQMRKRDWLKLLLQNRKTITGLAKEGFVTWKNSGKNKQKVPVSRSVME